MRSEAQKRADAKYYAKLKASPLKYKIRYTVSNKKRTFKQLLEKQQAA